MAPPHEERSKEPGSPPTSHDQRDQCIQLRLDEIGPNPYQPRRAISEAAVADLADSIRQDGLIQPVVVRPASGGGYQLVAGERRWRAAKLAGLNSIPALIRDLDEKQTAEWALIENLQREDLNPMERADAFQRLVSHFGLRHEDVAKRVGSDRATVTNLLRLLDLQQDIQELIRSAKLSGGHGRALLGIDDDHAQLAMARRAIAGGWSVRMVEAAVRRLAQPATGPRRKQQARSAHLADLAKQLTQQLGTKVTVHSARKKGSGTITIQFYSLEQFDGLLERMGVRVA